MRVDIALNSRQHYFGEEVCVEGWLINASNQSYGSLFYLVEDRLYENDPKHAIFIAGSGRIHTSTQALLLDALLFLAPYGRLSPVEARITGVIDCPEAGFPMSLSRITRVEVAIPKWGYSGVFDLNGVEYPCKPISVIDLVKNHDMFEHSRVSVDGILTGNHASADEPETCYLADRRYLARPPQPALTDTAEIRQLNSVEIRSEDRRALYKARLKRERRNGILVRYDGILRKIIPPHYSGRAFFENVIISGTLHPSEHEHFALELHEVSSLHIKNVRNDTQCIQSWDLNRFPYGVQH